jgi:voltage-gated potassium channel
MYIEKWNLFDSLYMTIIIITTLGLQVIHPMSDKARIFTMIFAITSFVFFASLISIISSIIIEMFLIKDNRRKKMLNKIQKFKNHIIICGVGKIGKHVVDSMIKSKKNFVAVDNEEFIQNLIEDNLTNKEFIKKFIYIEGDPTKEDILLKAGIHNAYGLITSMPEDADNLFICLTAKKLNPKIKISSYVIHEENIKKFYLVGTDEVVSGDFVIGKRLTASLINDNIAAFIEQTSLLDSNQQFYIGDIEVGKKSKIINKSLSEANIYLNTGLLIFAVKKKNQSRYTFNPSSDTVFEEGDVLITFGSDKDIKRLDDFVNK